MNVTGPFIGVNRSLPSHKLPLEAAEDALNCVLANGRIRKRDGYTVNGTGAPASAVLGQHDYLKNDGTKIQIVKVGGSLYKNVAGTLTAITSGGGFSTGDLASFRTINDRVYIADPGATPKVTDGTVVESMVITPPPYAPTLAVGSGAVGPLRGVYDYKYSYYSSTWGIESPSSPSKNQAATADEKTSSVSVTDGFVVLTNFATTADTRFDKFRIYRRNLSVKGSEWFLVEEVADTVTTYNDYTPDRSLDITSLAPLSYTQTLPAFRYLEYQSEVLFLAGADADPNGLYFSPPSKPGAAVSRIPVDPGGGGIMGLLAIGGELAIFCRRSIWLLSGTSRSNFYLRKVVPDVGCVAGHSIVAVGNVAYFLSEQGFARWDLSSVNAEISNPVQDLVLARNITRDKLVVGEHDDKNNAIWWLYSSGGSSTSDAMLLFFYANSNEVEALSWMPWAIPNCTSFKLITDGTSNIKGASLGFTDGKVARYGGTNDDTAAINWFWQTGRVDEGAPAREKRLGEIVVEVTKQTQVSPMVVSLLREEETEAQELFRFFQSRTTARARIRQRARRYAVRFSNNHTDAPTELVGWNVEATPVGRAQ